MTSRNAPLLKAFEAASGPWTNLSHTYCQQMDQALKAAEPAWNHLARLQAEWVKLATARGHAWATLPADISRCKTPVDLALLQVRFWQTAGQAYAQGWQRALAASTHMHAATQAAQATAARDVMSVLETAPEGQKRRAA